jgi:hypothetical protein
LENPTELSGEAVLPGFILNLARILNWKRIKNLHDNHHGGGGGIKKELISNGYRQACKQ